jgi:guanylate cyclase
MSFFFLLSDEQRCGRFFCDFLSGIDSVHLHMKYRYPKMDHPFIYVLEEDADGVVIHYRTSRIGFYPYLYGNRLFVRRKKNSEK